MFGLAIAAAVVVCADAAYLPGTAAKEFKANEEVSAAPWRISSVPPAARRGVTTSICGFCLEAPPPTVGLFGGHVPTGEA